MKAHILLAHPEPGAFNGTLAAITAEELAAAGWETSLTDLYADGFDPVEGPRHFPDRADPDRFHVQTEQRAAGARGIVPPDVAGEVARLKAADLLVVHFPLWWFGPPAILKGWIDRVFVYGDIYKSDRRYDRGLFRGRRMIACVTTGAGAEASSPSGREGDARLVLWPFLYCFRYVGYTVLEPVFLHGVGGVSFLEGFDGEQSPFMRLQGRWRDALRGIADRPAIAYNRDTDFDETLRLKPDAPVHSPFTRHEV